MSREPVSIKQEPAGARGIEDENPFTFGYCATSSRTTLVGIGIETKTYLPWIHADCSFCVPKFQVVRKKDIMVEKMEEAIEVCCVEYHGAREGEIRLMNTDYISDRLAELELLEKENSKTALKIITTYKDAEELYHRGDFCGVIMLLDVDSSDPRGEKFLLRSIIKAISGIRNNQRNQRGRP